LAFLGDSGYPLSPFLITPLRKAKTREEKKFNKAHAKTRVLVEQVIGVIKNVWRSISRSGGILLYDASKVARLAVTCAVLHNMRITFGIANVPLPQPIFRRQRYSRRAQSFRNGSEHVRGDRKRKSLICLSEPCMKFQFKINIKLGFSTILSIIFQSGFYR